MWLECQSQKSGKMQEQQGFHTYSKPNKVKGKNIFSFWDCSVKMPQPSTGERFGIWNVQNPRLGIPLTAFCQNIRLIQHSNFYNWHASLFCTTGSSMH